MTNETLFDIQNSKITRVVLMANTHFILNSGAASPNLNIWKQNTHLTGPLTEVFYFMLNIISEYALFVFVLIQDSFKANQTMQTKVCSSRVVSVTTQL